MASLGYSCHKGTKAQVKYQAHLGAEKLDAGHHLSHVPALKEVNSLEETRLCHTETLAERQKHLNVLHLPVMSSHSYSYVITFDALHRLILRLYHSIPYCLLIKIVDLITQKSREFFVKI